MPQLITNGSNPGTSGTTDGELLRLVSAVKTLIQGAAPDALARLGTERLTALKNDVENEQDAIVKAATQVKAAINSSLSIGELAGLGMKKLQDLGGKVGVKVGSDPRLGDYASYDPNNPTDA